MTPGLAASTPSDCRQRLREEIDSLLEPEESVILYELSSATLVNRTVYGEDPTEDERFL